MVKDVNFTTRLSSKVYRRDITLNEKINFIYRLNIVRFSLILFIGLFHRELKWVTKGADQSIVKNIGFLTFLRERDYL